MLFFIPLPILCREEDDREDAQEDNDVRGTETGSLEGQEKEGPSLKIPVRCQRSGKEAKTEFSVCNLLMFDLDP